MSYDTFLTNKFTFTSHNPTKRSHSLISSVTALVNIGVLASPYFVVAAAMLLRCCDAAALLLVAGCCCFWRWALSKLKFQIVSVRNRNMFFVFDVNLAGNRVICHFLIIVIALQPLYFKRSCSQDLLTPASHWKNLIQLKQMNENTH